MDNILSKISELNISGYYDVSNGYVVIWMFNSVKSKPDIVAYLQQDMSWDVREVAREVSKIYKDREEVIVYHTSLGEYETGSEFDIVVRKMLDEVIKNSKEIPDAVKKMDEILKRNSYGMILGDN